MKWTFFQKYAKSDPNLCVFFFLKFICMHIFMLLLVFVNEHSRKQEGCVWMSVKRSKDCSSSTCGDKISSGQKLIAQVWTKHKKVFSNIAFSSENLIAVHINESQTLIFY